MLPDIDTAALFQARVQAVKLRRAGMPYPAISIALLEYHGVEMSKHQIRYVCRNAGCPSGKHRGQMFEAAQ